MIGGQPTSTTTTNTMTTAAMGGGKTPLEKRVLTLQARLEQYDQLLKMPAVQQDPDLLHRMLRERRNLLEERANKLQSRLNQKAAQQEKKNKAQHALPPPPPPVPSRVTLPAPPPPVRKDPHNNSEQMRVTTLEHHLRTYEALLAEKIQQGDKGGAELIKQRRDNARAHLVQIRQKKNRNHGNSQDNAKNRQHHSQRRDLEKKRLIDIEKLIRRQGEGDQALFVVALQQVYVGHYPDRSAHVTEGQLQAALETDSNLGSNNNNNNQKTKANYFLSFRKSQANGTNMTGGKPNNTYAEYVPLFGKQTPGLLTLHAKIRKAAIKQALTEEPVEWMSPDMYQRLPKTWSLEDEQIWFGKKNNKPVEGMAAYRQPPSSNLMVERKESDEEQYTQETDDDDDDDDDDSDDSEDVVTLTVEQFQKFVLQPQQSTANFDNMDLDNESVADTVVTMTVEEFAHLVLTGQSEPNIEIDTDAETVGDRTPKPHRGKVIQKQQVFLSPHQQQQLLQQQRLQQQRLQQQQLLQHQQQQRVQAAKRAPNQQRPARRMPNRLEYI